MQHLQAFAVFNGPVQQAGNAFFNALDQRGLAALKEHAVAGAVGVDLFAPRLGCDGEGPGQAWFGVGNQGVAFFGRQQVAKHHDARLRNGQQHTHAAVAAVDLGGGFV
ncbi:hypothetical protein D3C72_2079940 [compost metagenome]